MQLDVGNGIWNPDFNHIGRACRRNWVNAAHGSPVSMASMTLIGGSCAISYRKLQFPVHGPDMHLQG